MRVNSLLSALLLLHSACYAAPIKFTYSGTSSGVIGGSSFSDTPFVISAFGDTLNRFDYSTQVTLIPHGTAKIELDGIGQFTISTPTYSFVSEQSVGGRLAGIGRVYSGSDLIWTGAHPELNHWDMGTSIGPLTGLGTLLLWNSAAEPMLTSGGQLELVSHPTSITFQADVAPEPSTIALVAIGCAAIGYRRR